MDLVFIRTAPRPNPRIVRMAIVAEKQKLSVKYLGARRELDLKDQEIINDIDVERVGVFYPMLNGKSLFKYITGTLGFNFSAFRKLVQLKPAIVHVSDVESFIAGFMYKVIFRKKMIYNIHDNLAQRYTLPSIINKTLNVVEGVIVKCSDISLVPESFRRSSLPKFCQKKVQVVRNSPMEIDFIEPSEMSMKSTINILYSGWIDSKRGVENLFEVIEQLPNSIVKVVGEGDPELIERFKIHPQCQYIGYVDYKTSLELLKSIHFVFIHYSPERTINRFAAPNKLAESLAVGKPVIINREIVLSKLCEESKCGVVTEYGNRDQLVSEIKHIVSDSKRYNEMCSNSRLLYDKEYSWDRNFKTTQEIYLRLLKK